MFDRVWEVFLLIISCKSFITKLVIQKSGNVIEQKEFNSDFSSVKDNKRFFDDIVQVGTIINSDDCPDRHSASSY